jgi:hypothetical protein
MMTSLFCRSWPAFQGGMPGLRLARHNDCGYDYFSNALFADKENCIHVTDLTPPAPLYYEK